MLDKELILHRDLGELPTEQLRAMLHVETDKDSPDDDLVLTILHILEDREIEVQAFESTKEKEAWELFQKRVQTRRKRKMPHIGGFLKVASVVLIACLLFSMIPQKVEADNWWDRLTRWTDDFFGFFREEETFQVEAYEFRTDNPGLQQVYDAVVEMGVTIPAVPMWLPEGYELVECTAEVLPRKSYIYARLLNNDSECTLKINLLNADSSKAYFKTEVPVTEHEDGGVIHNIMQSTESWIVSWTKDNIECAIFIDCPENVLYEIIASIYRWRMNE